MMIKRMKKVEKERQEPGIYKKNMEEDGEQGEARLTPHSKTSIANCTSNTSDCPRVTWTALLVLYLACVFSKGLEIESEPLIITNTVVTHYYNYCLRSGEPLRFLEPPQVPGILRASRQFAWIFYYKKQTAPTIMYTWNHTRNIGDQVIIRNPTKYQQHQRWGLEVLNVTKEDEGLYLAHEYGPINSNFIPSYVSEFDVTMLSPPKLSSGRLELTRIVVNDQSVKLTCGEVEYVGDPPITLELKAAVGTVLKSKNTEGSLSFTIPRKDDTGDFVCEINWNISKAASSCLNETERKAWKVMGPPLPTPPPISTTEKTAAPERVSKADSSMITYVLVGLVAAVVVALVSVGIKSMMKEKAPVQNAVTSKLEHVEVAPVESVAPRAPLAVPEENESIYGTLI